jgi:type IV pilus assembly protein PilC
MLGINGVSRKDITEFNRMFSLLLLSKISIVDSLELSMKQVRNDSFRSVLNGIIKNVRKGDSLARSFARYPKVFPGLYIANLQVAEETGRLAEVLHAYNEYTEKIQQLYRKLIQASLYPLIVLVVAGCSAGFMLLYLIPSFEGLFGATNVALPAVTASMLSISAFVQEYFPYIAAGAVVLPAAFIYSLKMKSMKKHTDRMVGEIPFIGGLYKENLLARFSLSMSILLDSGVTLVDALKHARSVSGNSVFNDEISLIIKKLNRGDALASTVARSKYFDANYSKLLSAGEESAELGTVFALTGNHYSRQFDHTLDLVTSVIEPVLIISVGVLVAFILVAMYLPLFEIINNFGV